MITTFPTPSALTDAISGLLSCSPELAGLTLGGYLALSRSAQNSETETEAGQIDIRGMLSEREFDVVQLIAEGLSNKQISLMLELSDKTVKNHISHILKKLHLTARTQVAIMAIRAGFA